MLTSSLEQETLSFTGKNYSDRAAMNVGFAFREASPLASASRGEVDSQGARTFSSSSGH